MMPKKILDLRNYSGLPKFIVFSDDDTIVRPYSSWDVINNAQRVVETNIYRRYDVVFSSLAVRAKRMHAISQSECVKAHCVLETSSCVIHLFDVIEPDIFLDRCRTAPVTDKDYLLIIHEVSGTYQIVSGVSIEEYGYLSDVPTYVRR